MDAQKKLGVSQLRILNTNALRLFGCLLYNFDTIFMKTEDIYTPDMSQKHKDIIDSKVTAMATIVNGKPTIGFYSTFIDECSTEELTFVNLHEIMHILQKDCTSTDKYPESHLHNLAADHIINVSLKHDIDKGIMRKVEVPEDAFIIDDLVDNKAYTTVTEVYNWLIDNAKTKGGIQTLPNGIEYYQVEINGKDHTVITDIKPGNGAGEIDKEVIESLQAEARTILDTVENLFKGSESGSAVGKLIRDIVKLEIPWTSLLDKSISQKLVPDSSNRSWKGLQKRPFALGLYYPTEDVEEKPSQLIILEDQSGSVSGPDIKKFASVLMQSIRYFDEVRIMRHDVRVHRDKLYKCNQTTIHDLLFEAIGGGGTSHKYCFDRIEESFDEGDDISLVIMLTDFYSDIESIWKKYEWTKHIPVSIVCNSSHEIPQYVDKTPIYITNNNNGN